jgi:hypothetical protein
MHHHFILIVQLGADRNCWGYAGSPKPLCRNREAAMKTHRYFAILTLICMAMTIVTGWELTKEH